MEVDVLDYVIEELLSMECDNKRQRPVVFLPKSLNKIERNYEIYNKEILVIIRGLENQRYLLESARFKFKVWTDYNNLEYFIRVQKLNRKQACWALYLSKFDFTLKHVPGIKMEKSDKLSRRPNWKVRLENDNNNQTLIKKQQIYSLAEVVIEEPKVDILEKIKIAKEKDKEVAKVVEEIKKVGVKAL